MRVPIVGGRMRKGAGSVRTVALISDPLPSRRHPSRSPHHLPRNPAHRPQHPRHPSRPPHRSAQLARVRSPRRHPSGACLRCHRKRCHPSGGAPGFGCCSASSSHSSSVASDLRRGWNSPKVERTSRRPSFEKQPSKQASRAASEPRSIVRSFRDCKDGGWPGHAVSGCADRTPEGRRSTAGQALLLRSHSDKR